MNVKITLFWILIAAMCLTFGCTAGDDDDDDDRGTGNPSDDDDDNAADDDDDNDDDTVDPWEGITITDAHAPDQFTVMAVFDQDPGIAAVDAQAYALTSPNGALTVEAAVYNATAKTATLTTAKQPLGLTLTLTVGNAEKAADAGFNFLAADTALIWAVDFGSPGYGEYQVSAVRAGVGDYCVIYTEQGMPVLDVDETIALFDDEIYPVETDLFITPDDIDGNDRILILGLDGGNYYGGYFSSINSYSNEQTLSEYGIHSNEMEMFYTNIISQTLEPRRVVPHEFQHLLFSKKHQSSYQYWEYIDEGLAECAGHAVFGVNESSLSYYLADPYGIIGQGLSLVNWTYAQYENYNLAYLFWTYLASRLDGVDSYGTFFNFQNGNPDEVNDFIETELASDFNTVQFENLIANWVQDETGPYGYGEMLSFAAGASPVVSVGTESVDLEPYAGTYFPLSDETVDYPDTQGDNIIYAGIDIEGNVDLAAPFTVDGGVLVVYNANDNHSTFPAEHSGPDLPAESVETRHGNADVPPTWFDPPVIHPDRLDRLAAWRYATLQRLARQK